jgi:hypothetical protein
VSEGTGRWKVSFEIEGRYDRESAFEGFHRIVTGVAPVLTIPADASVEDITPKPVHPVGTILYDELTGHTLRKAPGRWWVIASDLNPDIAPFRSARSEGELHKPGMKVLHTPGE